jgi:hypothetical protein
MMQDGDPPLGLEERWALESPGRFEGCVLFPLLSVGDVIQSEPRDSRILCQCIFVGDRRITSKEPIPQESTWMTL